MVRSEQRTGSGLMFRVAMVALLLLAFLSMLLLPGQPRSAQAQSYSYYPYTGAESPLTTCERYNQSFVNVVTIDGRQWVQCQNRTPTPTRTRTRTNTPVPPPVYYYYPYTGAESPLTTCERYNQSFVNVVTINGQYYVQCQKR